METPTQSPTPSEERQPLPQTRLVLEAWKTFQTLAPTDQQRIREKARAHAERSLKQFVKAIGSLPAPRAQKKKVVESFFGDSLDPCGKANDAKAQNTLEAATLLSTAIVMYEEGLLSEKPPVIEIAQSIPETPAP